MTETPPQGAPAPASGPDGAAPSLQIAQQYIKDLSFENPSAANPAAGRKPSLQIAVDVQVFAERHPEDPVIVKVTEAQLVYVALNADGSKRVVPTEPMVAALTRA